MWRACRPVVAGDAVTHALCWEAKFRPQVLPDGSPNHMPKAHRLDAGADTVHWGYFDAALKPLLTDRRPATPSPSRRCPARRRSCRSRTPASPCRRRCRRSTERAAEARRPAHPHRPGRGARRQGRAGARGPHQGDRAALRLGLQHHPPLAGALPDDFKERAHPHPARPGADDRHSCRGASSCR